MYEKLSTERLYFKRLKNSYKDEFFKITGNAEVMQYWLGGADKSAEETEQRIVTINNHWEKYNFGDWGIFKKESGELIGFGGLHYVQGIKDINIGYALRKSQWRKGFAYESCQFFIKYAFNNLNIDKIIAVIWPQNRSSINLVKKCRFHFQEETEWNKSARVIYRKIKDND